MPKAKKVKQPKPKKKKRKRSEHRKGVPMKKDEYGYYA